MKLFVVRLIKDKQAVGIFWAADIDDLFMGVDEVVETMDCEFQIVTESSALVWDGYVPALGVPRDFSEDQPRSPGEIEVEKLMNGLCPEGGLSTFFYNDETEGDWTPMSDYPESIIPYQLAREHRVRKPTKAKRESRPPTVGVPASETAPIPDNIYFIGCDGHVKIGITAGKVEKRLKTMSTGHYSELTILATIHGVDGALEIELHQRFAQHRVRGEWFKLCPEIEAFIERVRAGTWRDEP